MPNFCSPEVIHLHRSSTAAFNGAFKEPHLRTSLSPPTVHINQSIYLTWQPQQGQKKDIQGINGRIYRYEEAIYPTTSKGNERKVRGVLTQQKQLIPPPKPPEVQPINTIRRRGKGAESTGGYKEGKSDEKKGIEGVQNQIHFAGETHKKGEEQPPDTDLWKGHTTIIYINSAPARPRQSRRRSKCKEGTRKIQATLQQPRDLKADYGRINVSTDRSHKWQLRGNLTGANREGNNKGGGGRVVTFNAEWKRRVSDQEGSLAYKKDEVEGGLHPAYHHHNTDQRAHKEYQKK
ncbi:unnamed protein product [Linum trigynum]|uniref:Uncharacterized protein n=1 Tax=Linum trigynum TaxID=586398 RepID=A0AAV2F582_9ROSI